MSAAHWSGWCCIGFLVGIRSAAQRELGAPPDPHDGGERARAKVLLNDTGVATLWLNRRTSLDGPFAPRPARSVWLEVLDAVEPPVALGPRASDPAAGDPGVRVACFDVAPGRYRMRSHDDPSAAPSDWVELLITT
jgi:hypothetical protein